MPWRWRRLAPPLADGRGRGAWLRRGLRPEAALASARCCRRSTIPIRPICIVTGTGLTHLGSAEARDKMHKDLRRPSRTHRLDEDVPHGARRRQAGGGPEGRAAGMVLQGRRLDHRRARRGPAVAVLRAGRRRGAGGRRHLCHRAGRQPLPPRLRARQRVLRPRHRAAELSLSRPFQAAGLRRFGPELLVGDAAARHARHCRASGAAARWSGKSRS